MASHGKPRGRKPAKANYGLDSHEAQRQAAAKAARKAKLRTDRANKRRKGRS